MLVLSFKKDESMTIGGQILVKLLGANGGQAKVGVEAPPCIGVARDNIQNWTPREHEAVFDRILLHVVRMSDDERAALLEVMDRGRAA